MKILIVSHAIERMGGVTTALINMLKDISSEKRIDISLLLFDETSDLSEIPASVHVLRPSFFLKTWFASRRELGHLKRITWYAMHGLGRVVGEKRAWELLIWLSPAIGTTFDVAIAFENDIPKNGVVLGANDYVIKRVSACKKISYVHNDPNRLGFTEEYMKDRYAKFDTIVGVSDACTIKMQAICPELGNKVTTIRNFNAHVPVLPKKNRSLPHLRIVTLARLDNEQKRIDRIVDCCECLKASGFSSFNWDIFGSGPDESFLKSYAAQKNVADVLRFAGVIEDSIATIHEYDLFVLASDYEACPLVLIEARVAGTVVLTTNYEEAYENVLEEKTGVIVPKDASALASEIVSLYSKPERIFDMEKYMVAHPSTNEKARLQLFKVINYDKESME